MVRHVLLVQMDTAKANDLVRSGKLGETIGTILAEQKPEAVYFTELDGVRTGIMIIDIAAESDIPQIAEPYFFSRSTPSSASVPRWFPPTSRPRDRPSRPR